MIPTDLVKKTDYDTNIQILKLKYVILLIQLKKLQKLKKVETKKKCH